jgi:hypothetical protein
LVYTHISTNFAAVSALSYDWGTSGDIPVAGDFDKDGKNRCSCCFRPSNGTWYIRKSSEGYSVTKSYIATAWGTSGDIPVAGDFDGDGKADLAVF